MSKKVLTFIDAGVLITAARGAGAKALAAFSVLDDPDREFASSLFVQIEVLPKAMYNKQQAEESFYRTYFAAVSRWADSAGVLKDALKVARDCGLSAMDGLHL